MKRIATTRDDSRLFALMAQTPASEVTRTETDIDFDLVTRHWKEKRETELVSLRLWRDAFEQRLQNVESNLRNLTGELNRLATLLSDNLPQSQHLPQAGAEVQPAANAPRAVRRPRTGRRPDR